MRRTHAAAASTGPTTSLGSSWAFALPPEKTPSISGTGSFRFQFSPACRPPGCAASRAAPTGGVEDPANNPRGRQQPEVRHNTAAQQRAPETVPEALLTADRVLVRRDGHVLPLSQFYDGPYAVLRRTPRVFTIRMGERDETVHVQRLKPFTAAAEPAAQPPRRGLPPAPPAPPTADAPPRGASSHPGPPLAPLPPMRRVRFTLPPRDQPTARGRENANPSAEEPGTVCPSDTSEGFFVRPGSSSTDTGRPQRLRRPP